MVVEGAAAVVEEMPDRRGIHKDCTWICKTDSVPTVVVEEVVAAAAAEEAGDNF